MSDLNIRQNIKTNLARFASDADSMPRVCRDLFDSFGISITPTTDLPFSFEEYYSEVWPRRAEDGGGRISGELRRCLSFVRCLYLVGSVFGFGGSEADNLVAVRKSAEQDQYAGMLVFAADLSCALSRTQMAVLTRGLNRLSSFQPTVLLCRHHDEDGHTFLSIATNERVPYGSKWWAESVGRRILGKVSLLQDINCATPHTGHLDILASLAGQDCKTFADLYAHWMSTFSTKLLTDKFYKDLYEWYSWAIRISKFPNDLDTLADDQELNPQSCLRLITRLIFVWFIKQKGLVPDAIFNPDYVGSHFVAEYDNDKKAFACPFNPQALDPDNFYNSSYYRLILQNLFFATLNCPINEADGKGVVTRQFKDNSKTFHGKNEAYGVKNIMRWRDEFRSPEAADEFLALMNSSVPFLNGGLFQCLDHQIEDEKTGKRQWFYMDGFSEKPVSRNSLYVPNALFFGDGAGRRGIVDILQSYVFTVEESTPLDQSVGLDPELLGKVFENLLGTYNPETRETARNQSGSFYTPRAIVQYMVNESLAAHVRQQVGDAVADKLVSLMTYADDEANAASFSDAEKRAVLRSLYDCQILDPACGSGAFPMGCLQQMVHIIGALDADNKMWRQIVKAEMLKGASQACDLEDQEERSRMLGELDETFESRLNNPDYARKLYLIDHCIYGVDKQTIAIQISKLRFFISLVVDQTPDPQKPNFGIRSLPNLEAKLVAADTLLACKLNDFDDKEARLFRDKDPKLAALEEELRQVRSQIFYVAKRSQKKKLEEREAELRRKIKDDLILHAQTPDQELIDTWKAQIAKSTEELKLYAGKKIEERRFSSTGNLFAQDEAPGVKIIQVNVNKAKRDEIKRTIKSCEESIEKEQNKTLSKGYVHAVSQLADWNPYDQNAVAEFFDPEWMFCMRDGFDIVIGNPPYIQLQNNGGELAHRYEGQNFQTFARTGDIYSLFYERGFNLLRPGGHLCYITSNKWMRAAYGEATRRFFASQTDPLLLIDFAGVKIFEGATVDTNILLLARPEDGAVVANHGQTLAAVATKENRNLVPHLAQFVRQAGAPMPFRSADAWVILSPIELSIKSKIEAAGTPLKDWDIEINYGIKTGYNDAFIITTEKRDEILAACADEAERSRTAELIRPILRGRDIKRYAYDWAGLYLIATFPALHYDIDDYPAVKDYLLSFGIERLEQTGEEHIVNGERVKARKKTTNKWFETQDSIAYWGDFARPKIVWIELSDEPKFAYAGNITVANTVFFLTGKSILHILGLLNSKAVKWYFHSCLGTTSGQGTNRWLKYTIEQMPLPKFSEEMESLVSSMNETHDAKTDLQIDRLVCELYGLSEEETEYILAIK